MAIKICLLLIVITAPNFNSFVRIVSTVAFLNSVFTKHFSRKVLTGLKQLIESKQVKMLI